ncbi:MAG: flagellar cap protein FliD, partial [Ignavibacteriales bacterium CG_4_9_14_3_um_filter_34_10]
TLDSPSTGDVKLQLSVEDSDDYITISSKSGFDVVTDLGISVTKEKGASGIVTASVFSPSSGLSQFSVTSKNTGVDYRIKDLSDASGSAALTQLGLNLGATRTSYDQTSDPDTPGFLYSDITSSSNLLNSKLTFNGISIQNNSNNIDNLVSGVTFNLNSVMQGTDNNVNVSVANDVSVVKSKVEEFVTKFNDIYKYLKSGTSSVDGNRGNLISDSNANSLMQFFRSIAYSEVSGLPASSLKYLTQIGITFSSTDGLSVSDSSLLEKKITDNADQVESLFNSSSGIANLVYDKIDPYLGSGGYLALSQSSMDTSISYLTDKISTAEKRIDKSAEVLRNKYQVLQNQLSILLTSSNLFSSSSSDSYF